MSRLAICGRYQIRVGAPAEKVVEALKRHQGDWGRAHPFIASRFALSGQNPVGTAPMWGVVAIDPVWTRSGNRHVASPTACTLTVDTWPDPTLAPEHWTDTQLQYHHDVAARHIGDKLLRLIELELPSTSGLSREL